CMQPLKFPWTF
nr:immunoglobulin light chain junction region [Macaca mulatta]